MPSTDDPLTVFQLLARAGVPFVIIGGHAVVFHGHVRTTEDADLIFARSEASEAALLEALQAIERAHGRQRDGTRWGPRTLDLDILLYGDERLREPGLQIPHPEMGNRAFVLVPLADVAAEGLSVPGMGPLTELIERCPSEGVIPMATG